MPPKPSEKRSRVSSFEEEGSRLNALDWDAILKDIQKKLEKLGVLNKINERLIKIETKTSIMKDNISEAEKGLNSVNSDLTKLKSNLEEKANAARLEALEDELEEICNRSCRNNLVFFNVPEKAEGSDCAAFIQYFIATHMGLEALCGHIDIERADRTPAKSSTKQPRPIHVALLRLTDKMKILANAAARLKGNPFKGNQMGIGPDFAEKTQDKRKALLPLKKHLKEKLGQDSKVFISYHATLKYVNEDGKLKIVKDGDFKVPITKFFLFSHLNLNIILRTSVKKIFNLD